MTGRTGDGLRARWRGAEPLGRRGLVIGVLVIVAVAALGGSRLLRSPGRTAAGVARAFAPFPGFPEATPMRRTIGSSGDAGAAYAAIATQGTADWRRQFARAGVDWQDPTWALRAPPIPADRRRARIILDVGTHLGEWVQQLVGVPGLLEVARRQGRISSAAVRTETADLVGCLAGVWGRSVIPAADLTALASARERAWVARGAQTGVPSDCAPAAGG